jgi:hypothetical protein
MSHFQEDKWPHAIQVIDYLVERLAMPEVTAAAAPVREALAAERKLSEDELAAVKAAVDKARADVCLLLQKRVVDTSIRARGPCESATPRGLLDGVRAEPIDSEFFRTAPITPDGRAGSLPWFELCAEDVLRVCPPIEQAATPAEPLVEQSPRAKPLPLSKERELKAFLAAKNGFSNEIEALKKAQAHFPGHSITRQMIRSNRKPHGHVGRKRKSRLVRAIEH